MICAIVLAAGMSHRMGTQKLFLPFGNKTVITHIIGQLSDSVIDKIYVVTGHKAKRTAEHLCRYNLCLVTNPQYKEGMLSSVRCGFEALPENCKAALIALGDQPTITSELVNEMFQAFHKTAKGILVPVLETKRGHPVIISTSYKNEIMTCFDDVGLRGLMHAHTDDIFELKVSTPAVLSDMDSPDDYNHQLELLQQQKKNKRTLQDK